MAIMATGLWLPGASAAGTDRPDSFRTAKSAPASAPGKWLRETLGSAGDQDWFRFTLAQPAWALVTLGHLPADYAVALYDSHHALVGKSDRTGRRFEQLYRSLGTGDYFVKVNSPSGAHAGTPFALKFQPLAAEMVVAEQRNVHDTSTGFDIKGELLNNTSTWLEVRRIHVTWFDKNGAKLGGCDEGVIPAPVAPRHRVEFDVENGQPECGDQPSGAASYQLRVHTGTTTARTPAGLVMKPGTHTSTPTQRIYKGTVTNTSNQTMHGVYPTVIEYDSYGRAIAFGYDHFASLAPGKSRNYLMAINTSKLPKPNGFREYTSITNG
ncbi:MAG: bacillolysin [Frankiaceae bacterium]|jgi:hypothetical protein|nr:bacillolysin [Frankiaceae bacterium]